MKHSSYLSYYSRTSEAVQYTPSFPEEPIRKPKRKKIRKKALVRVRDGRQGLSACAIFTLCMIGAGLLGLAATSALQFNKRRELVKLQTELNRQQDLNAMAQAELSENVNLKEIEEIAITKLGMGKPQAYQIVHIKLPKQSHVIQPEVPIRQPEDVSFIEQIIEIIKEWL
jgi:cell division protein FtsL